MFTINLLASLGAVGVGVLVQHPLGDILIDSGDGVANALLKDKYPLESLKAIFISHEHFDHVAGLPALLTAIRCLGRRSLLPIFCYENPAHIPALIEIYRRFQFTEPDFSLELNFYHSTESIFLEGLQITPFPLDHRGPCYGFSIVAPHDPSAGRVVVGSDTIPCTTLKQMLKGASIAILEAAFPGGLEQIAHSFHHSTENDARSMAKGVPEVVLYHQLPKILIEKYQRASHP